MSEKLVFEGHARIEDDSGLLLEEETAPHQGKLWSLSSYILARGPKSWKIYSQLRQIDLGRVRITIEQLGE